MPDRSWKAVERRIAALFGAKRTGAQGDTTFDFIASDEYAVDGHRLGAEVKHRGDFPQWLLDAMAQARQHIRTVKNGPVDPVLILVPKGKKTDRALVVMELLDFEHVRHLAAAVSQLVLISKSVGAIEGPVEPGMIVPNSVDPHPHHCMQQADAQEDDAGQQV